MEITTIQTHAAKLPHSLTQTHMHIYTERNMFTKVKTRPRFVISNNRDGKNVQIIFAFRIDCIAEYIESLRSDEIVWVRGSCTPVESIDVLFEREKSERENVCAFYLFHFGSARAFIKQIQPFSDASSWLGLDGADMRNKRNAQSIGWWCRVCNLVDFVHVPYLWHRSTDTIVWCAFRLRAIIRFEIGSIVLRST